MQRWDARLAIAVVLSGHALACNGGDGAAEGSSASTTAEEPPPLPPSRPTVQDFVSACVSGFPTLPQPNFGPPPPTSESSSSSGDGASESGALEETSSSGSFGSSGSSGLGASSEDGGSAGSSGSSGLGASSEDDGSAGSSGGSFAGASSETTGGTLPQVEGLPAGPLRDTGHLVGVALNFPRLANNATYPRIAAQQFNYVTPENEMKWDAIEPEPGVFEFGKADFIVDFARMNHMKVKGHTLVWHSQLPSWAEELQTPEAVREAMTRHIQETMRHFMEKFPGVIITWDVVNEALDSVNSVVSFRNSVFYRHLGEGFIAEAFELAHAMDPSALLFYNDYGIESLGAKSQATYDMVRRMVESGVPIDGVGFQMHTAAFDWGPTRADFEANLQRYIDLGLRVNISEMDVTLCYGFGSPEEALAVQRERYRQMVGTCLQFEACDSVSFWGVADSNSWLNTERPCEDTAFDPWPLLFDNDYRPKPAWHGAYDAMTGCHVWP